MAETTHISTVVIGAGSGGLTVAIGLAALGREVALVEAGAIGGDCTNVGCIPSKTLIHLAEQHAAREGTPGDAAVVLATVQARRDHLRDEETVMVQQVDHLRLVRGRAEFVGPKLLEVRHADAVQRFSADQIVIATGSRARQITIPGLSPERVLTNENVFDQRDAPAHLAIVGSGVIAMELAFAFRKLGSRVTIVTQDQRVLASGVAEASAVLEESLREQGIDVCFEATAVGYSELTRTLRISGGAVEDVDTVLLALGRVRNIDRLGLQRAGVQFDLATGIPVDRRGRTNVPGIYAIGDVTPDSFWTHSANAQGRAVVQSIAFPLLPAPRKPLYPNATFSDPEVANVGMLPDQIARRYHPGLIKTLRIDLKTTDKGYTEGLERGFIQIYALRLTGRILGATIVGPRASEMISLLTLAITERISLYKLFRLVYPYPTLSLGIQKAADLFVRETLPHLPGELRAVTRYGLATAWQRLTQRFTNDAPPAPRSPAALPDAVESVPVSR